MSIGEECEFSISYDCNSGGKKDRKHAGSPVNWAKTDSLEKMIFNNMMLKQQSIQSSILEEGSDELCINTGTNNTLN
jgi:hypothetical protein